MNRRTRAPRAALTASTSTPTATATGHLEPPRAGWHWTEWLCELTGTAVLVLGGLSAVTFDFMARSPMASLVPSHAWRLLVTGIVFASTGALVTISPLGKRSGAHLNPAVSLAFFTQGHLHTWDLVGYVGAQCAGGILGAELLRLSWGADAATVRDGLTQPGLSLATWQAAGVEAAMTGLLVLVIFAFVSARATARWTPLAVLVVVAVLVWKIAPWTGTSLNPARSLGPAVVTGDWHAYWAYVVGPLAGAIGAAGVWALVPRATLTAKLFHDTRYTSVFRSILPAPRDPPAG